MPSKKSKPLPPRPSRWKAERSCSEPELAELAREHASRIRPGDWILLEGPMGAGKSTYARALLLSLGVEQPPEGSPTFAIAHEYARPSGPVVHIDLYRIRSAEEIDEAGIPGYFWERADAVVLVEWASMWPEFESSLREGAGTHGVWSVSLAFEESPERRRITVTPL